MIRMIAALSLLTAGFVGGRVLAPSPAVAQAPGALVADTARLQLLQSTAAMHNQWAEYLTYTRNREMAHNAKWKEVPDLTKFFTTAGVNYKVVSGLPPEELLRLIDLPTEVENVRKAEALRVSVLRDILKRIYGVDEDQKLAAIEEIRF